MRQYSNFQVHVFYTYILCFVGQLNLAFELQTSSRICIFLFVAHLFDENIVEECITIVLKNLILKVCLLYFLTYCIFYTSKFGQRDRSFQRLLAFLHKQHQMELFEGRTKQPYEYVLLLVLHFDILFATKNQALFLKYI